MIVYFATLPDGTIATRRSPTDRVYTAAVARCDLGVWRATSFARTEELAHREAATQARLHERYRRRAARDGKLIQEPIFAVVPASTRGPLPKGG